MSNRSLLEFNHDHCPHTQVGCLDLGNALRNYMRAADPKELPPGVIRKDYRHHSDPSKTEILAEALRALLQFDTSAFDRQSTRAKAYLDAKKVAWAALAKVEGGAK